MIDLTSKIKKVAILIQSLDAAEADALLDQMSAEDAQRVRNAIMELGDVTSDEQERIIADFIGRQESSPVVAHDSGVELTLSTNVARTKVAPRNEKRFAFLEQAPPDVVAKHLLREHPQTIAVVLAHLPPDHAAAIVLQFPQATQTEVLLRVGDIADIDRETVLEIEQGLEAALSRDPKSVRKSGAGVAALQAILSAAGNDRASLVRGVVAKDRQLGMQLGEGSPLQAQSSSIARTIPETFARKPSPMRPTVHVHSEVSREPTLEFAQLSQLDDRGWASLLRAVDSQVALLALAGASPELVTRLLRQLAPRDAKAFQRKMEQIGPVRLREIEQAQQQIARIAMQLSARGEIRIPRPKPFATAA